MSVIPRIALLVICFMPGLVLAVTGWAGQREKPDRPFSGHIEEQAFLTYKEALGWTLGNSSFPLVKLHDEYIVEGKRLHLFHRPSQYTPPSNFVGGEVLGCPYWPVGTQASRIHSSGGSPNHSYYRLNQLYDAYDSYNHIMYGPDGSFPSGNLAGYNNCIQPDNYTFWRISGTLSFAVHEVEILIDCPVDPLPPLPANDVCAQTLENIASTPAQKEAACGALTDEMKTARDCFALKLTKVSNLTTGKPISIVPASERRNYAYQKHFREIWDKMFEFGKLTPAEQTACAPLRAKVAGEKGCDHAGKCTPD